MIFYVVALQCMESIEFFLILIFYLMHIQYWSTQLVGMDTVNNYYHERIEIDFVVFGHDSLAQPFTYIFYVVYIL